MSDRTNDNGTREEIRAPGNSLVPFAMAAGLTLVFVGVVVSWLLFGLGAIVSVLALVSWIRSTRTAISELPSDQT